MNCPNEVISRGRMPTGARKNLLPRRCLVSTDVADVRRNGTLYFKLVIMSSFNHSLTDSLTPST